MTLSLIPRGEPQGDRQENVAAAQEAGLPTKISQEAPTAFSLPPPPISQATPRDTGGFDAIASRTPTSTGVLRDTQDSRVLNALEGSPSPALRDIARRLRGI